MAHAVDADVHKDRRIELRYENTALLKVRLAAHLPGRVELSSTRTVAIPSAYLSALSRYFAASCHSPRMLAYVSVFRQIPMESFIFVIAILILSIILHEVAHGYAAHALGDNTAKFAGRLTLNPIPHLDPVGSILIPGLLAFSGTGLLFGWAKPVPYNPYNLRDQRWGEAFVAIAGVATNFLLALMFALIVRVALGAGMVAFAEIAKLVVMVNLSLAIFNLIPIPPFDGYTFLRGVLPYRFSIPFRNFEERMRRGGILTLIIVLFLFSQFLSAPFGAFVTYIFNLLVGV